MNVSELKELIDGCIIDVPEGDCYIAMAKAGSEISVSFEGDRNVIANCLYRLMKKYQDLADVTMAASDAYGDELD